MQPTTEQQPSTSPRPAPAGPVMDVSRPAVASAPASATPDDGLAVPPPEPTDEKPEAVDTKKPDKAKAVAPVPKEKSKNNAVVAIVTAVVVVIALAALAVLAYMKGAAA